MQKEAADRPFFITAAALFVALVFLAFAQRYYLGWLFKSPQLSPFLQLHGAIMSGWVLLFIVQTGLVETGHIRWHRKLGTVGAYWAVLVVAIGTTATLRASIREIRAHTDIAPIQITITGLELVEMLLFAGFVASAVWLRRRGDYHKRLMLFTLVCMLPSVLPRLPLGLFQSLLSILLAVYGALALCIGVDVLRHRRLHPAFAVGGAVFVLMMQSAFFGMQTRAWHSFLTRLLS